MVRQRELLTYPLFDHPSITGDKVERLTIAQTDETANYSAVFRFDRFFQDSLGIIGIVAELDGNASDTITLTAEFYYGGGTTWGTKSHVVLNAVAANVDQFQRVDIMSGWRNYLPFDKVRFKIEKTGTNGACAIISRIVRL